MAIITAGNRAFQAISDALRFRGSDGVTQFDTGPVKTFLDIQASLEAGVRYSEFVFLRTDAGAVTAAHDVRPHVLADWTEIINRGVNQVGIAGSEVPATHDAWIIRAGVSATVAAAFTNGSLNTSAATVGAGSSNVELFFADTISAGSLGFRAATHETPVLIPLPWWVPPTNEQTSTLRWRLATSAITSTNLTLGILSAPRGTFRRLY